MVLDGPMGADVSYRWGRATAADPTDRPPGLWFLVGPSGIVAVVEQHWPERTNAYGEAERDPSSWSFTAKVRRDGRSEALELPTHLQGRVASSDVLAFVERYARAMSPVGVGRAGPTRIEEPPSAVPTRIDESDEDDVWLDVVDDEDEDTTEHFARMAWRLRRNDAE